MLFSESFVRALESLSGKVSEQDLTMSDLLDTSIQAWCNYLALPKEIESYIIEGFSKQGFKPEYGHREILPGLGEDYFRISFGAFCQVIDLTSFIKNLDTRVKSKKQKIKFHLLCAFIIVSVGNTLFALSRVDQEIRQKTKGLESSVYQTQKPAQMAKNKSLLILVISAKHENIAKELKNSSSIASEMADRLYRMTQELWLGTDNSFANSPINYLFEKQNDREIISPSEYDVYFVKIKLAQEDLGFGEKVVSQLTRSDSFARLPSIAKEIEVSDRLPSRSYENIGVYSR